MATRSTRTAPQAEPQAPTPEPLPDTLQGVVDPETWGRADPYTRDLALKLGTQKAELEKKLAAEAETRGQATAQLTALQNQVNQLTQQQQEVASKSNGNSLQTYSADQLQQVREKIDASAQAAMAALAADPTDEKARTQLEEANGMMSLRRQVEDELHKRAINDAVGGLEKKWGETHNLEQMQARFGQELLVKYGPDALNKQSPLTKRALEISSEWERGNDLSSAEGIQLLAARMAYEQAATEMGESQNAELEPGLTEQDRRQLAILGAGERGTALRNQVAALRQRGDVHSKGEAARLQISSVIERLTGGHTA